MIPMTMIGKVRRMFHRQNKSVREIARLTSLSRNTISKYLNMDVQEEPKYQRRSQPTRLTPFHEVLVLAPTIGASNVHRGASKFSNVASVAIHFWEIEEFDSEISRAVQHRSWRLFQISMQGPFPAGYDAPCSIQLRDQAIPSSTVGPTRRHR